MKCYVVVVQVIVIEKGSVVEQGTHSELLARDGVYKQLVTRQLMAGDDGGRGEPEPPIPTCQNGTTVL